MDERKRMEIAWQLAYHETEWWKCHHRHSRDKIE